MIHGSWGCTPRVRFLGSKSPKGDGDGVCYVEGRGGRFVVVLMDGEDIPTLVRARRLQYKQPGGRWKQERR